MRTALIYYVVIDIIPVYVLQGSVAT